VADNPDERIEEVVYSYLLASGEVTFKRLLSYLARHNADRLRRDRVALVLGAMATKGAIGIHKEKSQWKIRVIKKS
jgi:hypothetical protein